MTTLMHAHYLPDNLAVSAQGFRRNANRVRKVRLHFLFRTVFELNISYRTCGKFLMCVSHNKNTSKYLLLLTL
jgi:hypothetical protein